MRQPVTERSVIETLQLSLRDPTGLVCAALLVALVAVAARIAAVW